MDQHGKERKNMDTGCPNKVITILFQRQYNVVLMPIPVFFIRTSRLTKALLCS